MLSRRENIPNIIGAILESPIYVLNIKGLCRNNSILPTSNGSGTPVSLLRLDHQTFIQTKKSCCTKELYSAVDRIKADACRFLHLLDTCTCMFLHFLDTCMFLHLLDQTLSRNIVNNNRLHSHHVGRLAYTWHSFHTKLSSSAPHWGGGGHWWFKGTVA